MTTETPDNRRFSDSRLILSAGTLPTTGFRDRVVSAKAAGFDAISLFPQQYLTAIRREKLTVSDMRDILATHEIALDEVDPLLDWFGSGPTPSESLMVEMAQAFGARSVNVAAAFVSDKPYEEIVACFAQVSGRVGRHGLRADLEFLPWTQIGSLTSALALLRDADQANAGVMFDCWHFFNSEDNLDTLRGLNPAQAGKISSLQVNDAPREIAGLSLGQSWLYIKDMLRAMSDSVRVLGFSSFRNVALKATYPHPEAKRMMKDALCSRLFPGEGVKPITEVLSVLDDKGVRPAIGVEVFSLDNRTLSPVDVARRAMQSYLSVV